MACNSSIFYCEFSLIVPSICDKHFGCDFAVSVILRYGYFGDSRMVLGPSSSRLMQASSVFVDRVEVRDEDKKGVLLHEFHEKPELSFETNWSVVDYMIVASYSRKVTRKALLFFSIYLYNAMLFLFLF